MKKRVVIILCAASAVVLCLAFFIIKKNKTDKLYNKLYLGAIQENAMLGIEHIDMPEEESVGDDPSQLGEIEVKTYDEVNIADLLLKNSVIKVLKQSRQECTCEVISPDYYQMLLDFAKGKELTLENAPEMARMLREYLISCLENGEFPAKSYELVLPIENGEPVLTDEYYNAVYGGALETFKNLLEQYEKEGE